MPPRHTSVRFPLEVSVEGEVTITIHSHSMDTAMGSIDCWTYVTRGLEAFDQDEIVMTVKRDPDESPEAYPDEVLQYLAAIVPLAQSGSRVSAGDFTWFGTAGGPFGGHVLYTEAQRLTGVELPPRAITAVAITADELKAAMSYGPLRVMARLGREASHYPSPPWSDRVRLNRPTPAKDQTILDGAARLRVPGMTAVYDGRGIRISISERARATLRKELPSWTLDIPLALLTDLSPNADSCLVWHPGLVGLNAILPPNSKAQLTAACFVLIAARQPANGWRLIEDGLGLLLTDQAAESLRDAFTGGGELTLATANGSILVEGRVGETAQIILLNPDDQLLARGVTAASLGAYIQSLLRVIDDALSNQQLQRPYDIIVAVRPEGRSRVWNTSPAVRYQLETVQPPTIIGGPIALGLRARELAGAQPFPLEWTAAAEAIRTESERGAVTIDEVLDRVWPESTL